MTTDKPLVLLDDLGATSVPALFYDSARRVRSEAEAVDGYPCREGRI
jgi:hypothetical protein